ncbi:MAG TPA: hypothetical protein VKS60_02705 [Stellaceae bacterium]|nr:hypothetical protein [Stellaceae bacterium]
MTASGLQKRLDSDDERGLKKSPLFPLLERDIRKGAVFPAIRKGEIHFYHCGGRLCLFRKGRFYTASRYFGELGESRDIAVKLNTETYETVKNGCRSHWSKSSERALVADLFKRFSPYVEGCTGQEAALIDIEIRFPGSPDSKVTQDKIDLLFELPNGKLHFVEVKRTKDPRVRQKSETPTPAELFKQLGRYRQHLSPLPDNGISATYSSVFSTMKRLFDHKLPEPDVSSRT